MTARTDALAGVGVVGNGELIALVSADGNVVWCCWPRPDADPIFCGLLSYGAASRARGVFSIELVGQVECSLAYQRNTAIVETTARDDRGNAIRVTTFCPRFYRYDRLFRPAVLVRRVEPVSGRPAIRIRLRPAVGYGEHTASLQAGSHHLRFSDNAYTLRATTDESISYLVEERAFVLDRAVDVVLGADEALPHPASRVASDYLGATTRYWLDWVRTLALPFEWQEATIRAAITLQLSQYDDTGAVLAAATTSVPERLGSARNWDHRYCWLRDVGSSVQAFNRLGAVQSLESLLRYLDGIVFRESESLLRPVYALNGGFAPAERAVTTLEGFLGMGPVRIGSVAHQQRQNDLYGSLVLACAHRFFDERMERPGDPASFARLEALGERAASVFDQADAGLWESRDGLACHTYTAAMCWAACDRLGRIAESLARPERARYWHKRADNLQARILSLCWSESRGTLSSNLESNVVDASLLLLPEIGIIDWADVRFQKSLPVIERELRAGHFMLRFREDASDNAFTACSFWWANALARSGRAEEARGVFDALLSVRNEAGLLAEFIDPSSGVSWGNFPRTSAMAALVSTAGRLSRCWDGAV